MALKFGQAKGEDVADLIARKQYAKAIEIIKAQLSAQKNDERIRLQLADVLVQAGRPQEAVAVLVPLADEYARDGFAAKAVAVLKRIQKIDPKRRDIEARLASLIEQKQKHATVPIAAVPARVEFGFEEIQPGLELGFESGDEISVPATPPPLPEAEPPQPELLEPEPPAADGLPATATEREEAPVMDHDLAFGEGEVEPLALEPVPPEAPRPPAEPEIVLEDEVLLEADPVLEAEAVMDGETEALILEVERAPAADTPHDVLGDDLFAQELMSVIDGVFPSSPPADAPAAASPESGTHSGGRQIVVSPLFRDFSVDELVAVIQGLKLLSYDAGEIIISEGEPGDSLYMLSAGRVKAFRRNDKGKQALLGEMSEGAFFGEMAVLTGKPRSATVVAATTCELLELDRPTLQQITGTHPHVWDVLREHAERRMKGQQ